MKAKKGGAEQSNRLALYRYILWFLAAVIITGIILALTKTKQDPPIADMKPGMAAPPFHLHSVRGQTFSLSHQTEQTMLISFLNTQADPTTEEPDPSRSQVVFLKSMQEQYGGKGVKILIVDASQMITGNSVDPNDLLNFTYNWSLDDQLLVLMDDQDNTTAKKYGVSQLPVTFLIDSNNTIVQRWDGYSSASQLAFALQELVGAPVHRAENFPIQPKASAISPQCDQVTPAQAKFAGLGPARALSDQIWVVDGGRQWGIGSSWPLQWVILDDSGISIGNDLHLSVTLFNLDTGEVHALLDDALLFVPIDEASGLLVGITDPKPAVHMLTKAVQLDTSGCYRLSATVTLEGQQKILYTGTGFIQAGE